MRPPQLTRRGIEGELRQAAVAIHRSPFDYQFLRHSGTGSTRTPVDEPLITS
jgi:hypothetical protein